MKEKNRQIAENTLAEKNSIKNKNSDCEMSVRDLKNLYYLKKEIEHQQRRIMELEAAATNCSAKITGLPSGKVISDKIGQYAAQIADLKALIDLNLKKCFYELNRLNRYIGSVDDPLIRQIVMYRFENHMSWRQIARTMGGNNSAESLRKQLYRYLRKN